MLRMRAWPLSQQLSRQMNWRHVGRCDKCTECTHNHCFYTADCWMTRHMLNKKIDEKEMKMTFVVFIRRDVLFNDLCACMQWQPNQLSEEKKNKMNIASLVKPFSRTSFVMVFIDAPGTHATEQKLCAIEDESVCFSLFAFNSKFERNQQCTKCELNWYDMLWHAWVGLVWHAIGTGSLSV